jgi:collagen type III alpha
MATVQEPAKSTLNRYEQFVKQELSRATRRVQFVDLARAGLGLVVITLVFGLSMMLLDKWLNLPQLVRQFALFGYLAFAAAYGWFVLLRPLRRTVNPYYAAVQVEQTVPDAKNSLVNWLDLHDDDLPPGVLSAIGQRAAEDLKESDVQQAIRGNSLVWLGSATAVLVVAFLIMFGVLRPDQFRSLLDRTFSPFAHKAIAKQTRISMVSPLDGNATVSTHRALTVTVNVEGRIPTVDKADSVRLLVRRHPEDPNYEMFPLEQSKHLQSEWSILVPPHIVHNGFWYTVAGGDDATPEYRIDTRSSPTLTRFETTFKYRPYLRWDPRHHIDPNIKDFVGTEVTLDAFANRTVRDGTMRIEADGKETTIRTELVPGQPEALRFRFVIERDAKYKIRFVTVDDESNNDPLPYAIEALRDQIPDVSFTKPEDLTKPDSEDLKIPSDGMLKLEGVAHDDFGISKMTLRMKLDGNVLDPKPYLVEKDFKLENGGYMRTVEYKDFIDFTQLKRAGGIPIKPETGMVLEYWLEAEDNFDFPRPQVGSTRHFKARLIDPIVREALSPEDKKDKQEERDNKKNEAKQEKANQEKQHEKDRKNESAKDEDRQKDRKRDQDQKEKEIEKIKEAQRQKNDGEKNKQNSGQKPENKPGDEGSEPKKEDGAKSEKDTALENAKKELDEQQRKKEGQTEKSNEPKPGESPKAEDKPAPQDPPNPNEKPKEPEGAPKPQPNGAGEQNKPSEMKPAPDQNMNGGQGPGENKQAPKPEQPQHGENKKPGEGSQDPSGKGDPMKKPPEGGDKGASESKQPPKNADNPMGGGNDMDPKAQQNQPGTAKGAPKDQKDPSKPNDPNSKDPKSGESGMSEPKPDDSNKPATAKNNPPKNDNAKTGDHANNQPQQQPAENKRKDGQAAKKSESKPDQNAKNDGKPNGESKSGNAANPKDMDKTAENKSGDSKNPMGNGETAKSETKPDQGNNPAQSQDAGKGDAAKEAAKLADQLKSNDPKTREQAAQKVADMMKNMADANKGQNPEQGEAAKEAAKLAEQMKNGDPKAQEQAGQKLGEMAKEMADANKGQNPDQGDAAKEAAKLAEDLKGNDPKAREEAAKKLADMMKKTDEANKGQNSEKGEAAKELAKLRDEMNSKDEKTREEANKKFGDMMKQVAEEAKKQGSKQGEGQKGDGQKGGSDKEIAKMLEQMMKEANPKTREDIAKKFAEAMKKMGEGDKSQDPKKGEGGKDIAKKLEQMKKESDPKAREEIAKQIGESLKKMNEDSKNQEPQKGKGDKEVAKMIEQMLKDADPKTREQIAQQIAQNAKEWSRNNRNGAPPEDPGKITDPNQAFKDRSGDLKLENVDKETLKKVYEKYKITPEELDNYLKNLAKAKTNPANPNKSDLEAGMREGGSFLNQGPKRIEVSSDKDLDHLRSGKSGSAPPEYEDAAREFSKRLAEQPKKK